jgi:hypothetical protein
VGSRDIAACCRITIMRVWGIAGLVGFADRCSRKCMAVAVRLTREEGSIWQQRGCLGLLCLGFTYFISPLIGL